MEFIRREMDWELKANGRSILDCKGGKPMIYVGYGEESVDMYRGNYKIEDYVVERRPLGVTGITEGPEGISMDMEGQLTLTVRVEGECAVLSFHQVDPRINRFWFRVDADEEECCYGCGEQMSYFNLRGRHFPLWTSEPGVGRDKTTYVTWRSDVENKAGGDYYNTNYPEPTLYPAITITSMWIPRHMRILISGTRISMSCRFGRCLHPSALRQPPPSWNCWKS